MGIIIREIIATPSNTARIIKEQNLTLNKKMGQNFVIDQNIIKKMVMAAEIKDDDNIIEIGSGIGALTQFILFKLQTGRLIAIEKDNRLLNILRSFFDDYSNIEFLNRDVLEIEWTNFLQNNGLTGNSFKIMSNLPYYITTPVIINLLEARTNCSRMVFMVQKEVAERIAAGPGNKQFGSLSVAVQFYCQAERIHDVSPEAFTPTPGVYSSIIRLTPYAEIPYSVEDRELFFNVVKAIFQQRRKKIKNSLLKASTVDFTREEVMNGLKKSNINPDIRGEKLAISKMVRLSNNLSGISAP